jgi:hypothetical protein
VQARFESAPFDKAIARLPRWIFFLASAGTAAAGGWFGMAAAGGFLAGSIAAYANLRLIERTVNRVARFAAENALGDAAQPARKAVRSSFRTGFWLLIQFAGLLTGAFVLLRFAAFNMIAALCGFLVCPAAVVLEIIFELVTYDHS